MAKPLYLMRQKLIKKTKTVLERLYARYNHRRCIAPDPLQFVYRYSDPADMEIVAFLASSLAYGRVQQIEKSLTDLFARMGSSPAAFVKKFDSSKSKKLKTFKHRFNTGRDISDLLGLFKTILNRHGSLEKFFLKGFSKTDDNIIPALSAFCDTLLDTYCKTEKKPVPSSLAYLLARPATGSACKRLNLFLRWMIRDDDVDTGLWKSIDTSKLIVPIDTHMERLCRILDLYQRKTVDLKAALEITESFAIIQPGDPVKYDFALSRIGIVEDCTGRRTEKCPDCELFDFCKNKQS
ncbi:MAG: TIGR02757 family protein [Planctomycetota bacterium]